MSFIPYTLSSDHHLHDWSQFKTGGDDAINSRLQIILDELIRQAEHGLALGIKRMVLAGDLFHVRGKLAPSVLNPAVATFKKICGMGIEVFAIAGNHDLEFVHSNELGNAMQALDQIDGFTAITEPRLHDNLVLIPWIQDLDDLRDAMTRIHQTGGTVEDLDLIIHAPVNGVIKGLPDHGLEAAELAALGFKRVFSGHYHDHKRFDGDVYSVGATTHQTWSDPGALAGYCIVTETAVEHVESQAPKFVNIDLPSEVDNRVRGNYVRLRLRDETESVLKLTRKACEDIGALGIVDHSSQKRETVRGEKNVATGLTLEAAVSSFVKDHLVTNLDRTRVAAMALDVLSETSSAGLVQ